MAKKYSALFKSLGEQLQMKDRQSREYYGLLMGEYLRYLSASRFELDELDLDEKRYDIARMYVQL